MSNLNNEIDFFPYAFNCTCGRPILVKPSEEGREITCRACQHLHGPFHVRQRNATSPLQVSAAGNAPAKHEPSSAADSTIETINGEVVRKGGRWFKNLGILAGSTILTYFLYPLLFREPRTYGIGGLRGRLDDVLELIEWDQDRILLSVIVLLIGILLFTIKAVVSRAQQMPGVPVGAFLALVITSVCLSMFLVGMLHHSSIIVAVAWPYMQLIDVTITKMYGSQFLLLTFLFILSCLGNMLFGCALGYLLTNRRLRFIGGLAFAFFSFLPFIQSFTQFALHHTSAGIEWMVVAVLMLTIGSWLLSSCRSR